VGRSIQAIWCQLQNDFRPTIKNKEKLMDPITTSLASSVVAILTRYAQDKGGELVKKIGDKAYAKARELLSVAWNRLRHQENGQMIAKEFEKTPELVKPLLEDKLKTEIEGDPEFARLIQKLGEQYETALKEHQAMSGGKYQGNINATAKNHSVIVVGDSHGDIIISHGGKAADEEKQ
jgi:hypothetical protein